MANNALRGVKKEWTSLEEIVDAALNRLDTSLAGRAVDTEGRSTLVTTQTPEAPA